jgi:hypothetical protein
MKVPSEEVTDLTFISKSSSQAEYRLLRSLTSLGLLREMPGRHLCVQPELQRAAFGVTRAELAELESALSRAG